MAIPEGEIRCVVMAHTLARERARDGDELWGRTQRRKRFDDASNEFAHLRVSRITPEQGRTE